MFGVLDRYISREISQTWAAVTIVLLVIMVANVLARILSRVTEGRLPADALLLLLGLKVINLLVTLIPLGLYLGILLAFGRLYRDNEMAASAACGAGLKSMYRPVLFNGLLGVLLITALTFYASPWAAKLERQVTDRIASQSVSSVLGAGRFVEILDGNAVVYTESLSAGGNQFEQVFVHRTLEDGTFEVETAESATYQRDRDDNEYIVFRNGVTVIADPEGLGYQRTEFARHGIRLPSTQQASNAVEISARSLRELWRDGSSQSIAEIQWRFSIPLAALLLALLAVPLSHTSPRQGRYSKIVVAILIYVPYANLLVLSRKWTAAGKVSPMIGVWWVHLLFIVVIIYFTVRRYGVSWLTGRAEAT
ncbi:MAG: LPS export ABC transporter permease LptF [Pseudomonadota bacterium]